MNKKLIRPLIKTSLLNPVKNSKGVALMMALFVMTVLTFLAVEVAFRTSIEANIATLSVARLKAYYAAKAGVELSLFRIKLYKQALSSLGETLGDQKSMLDIIWKFPMSWPPVLPDEASSIDKGNVQNLLKESFMKTNYSVTIESEGSKIDINDLGSESKELAKAVKEQILQLFLSEVEVNESFSKKYRSYNFEELVNNLQDWVDEDKVSLNGGDEKSYYRDTNSEFIPPNAPFKTIKELYMVREMNDDFYKILSKSVTVFGVKGININYADKAIISSIDPQITDELATKIIERRESTLDGEGPFKNEKDFLDFVDTGLGINTANFNPNKIPLIFDAALNFRIKSTGQAGKVTRDIEVVTFDFDNVKERYIDVLTKDQDQQTNPDSQGSGSGSTGSNPGTAGSTPGDTQPKNDKSKKFTAPKGRPRIVYWNEN